MKRRTVALAVLQPDILLRERLDDALARLASRGFRVQRYRIGAVGEDLIGAMHRDTFRWDVDSWKLNLKAYNFAPAIALLLVSRSQVIGHDALLRMKGHTLPSRRSRSSLREALQAPSRVFNALHVPDSQGDADEEARLWFGGTLLELQDPAHGFNVRASCRAEVQRHAYFIEWRLNAEATWASLIIRLLHAIGGFIPARSIADHIVSKLRRELLMVRGRFQNMAVRERRRLFRQAAVDFRRTVDQLLVATSSTQSKLLSQTLLILRSSSRGGWPSPRALEFFWYLCGVWRVYASELERYLVDTAAKYAQ